MNFRSKPLLGGIALAVVIGLVVVGLTICAPMTVVRQGTVLSVPSQHHNQYGFTRPPNSEGATYGEFAANNGVTLYVMIASQFNNFNSTGNPSSFIYSTGQVNSATTLDYGKNGGASYAYIKPPGQYYFMFYNAGSLTTTVTITRALNVETC